MIVHRFSKGQDMVIHEDGEEYYRQLQEGDWLVIFTHNRQGEMDDRKLLVALFKGALDAYPDSTEVFEWLMKLHADLGTEGSLQ